MKRLLLVFALASFGCGENRELLYAREEAAQSKAALAKSSADLVRANQTIEQLKKELKEARKASPQKVVASKPVEEPPSVFLAKAEAGGEGKQITEDSPRAIAYQMMLGNLRKKYPEESEKHLSRVCFGTWVVVVQSGRKDVSLADIASALNESVPDEEIGKVKSEEVGALLATTLKQK